MKLFSSFLLIALVLTLPAKSQRLSGQKSDPLRNLFIHIPDTVQTSVYWYWMSDNISKAGVIKDLHAMKKVGINRAFIGNIGYGETPYGKVKMLSDEWWDITHTALKTATELGIDIGMFNSPGWSQSGGPWIKPAQAMRYLSATDTVVSGGKNINILLSKPAGDFQDVRVVAFPAPANQDADQVVGRNIVLKAQHTTLAIDIPQAFTARSITIYPGQQGMYAEAELIVKDGAGSRSIKKFKIERSNTALNVGFDPFGPVAASFPATTSKSFSLVLTHYSQNARIKEIRLSAVPKVDSYIEKTLAKMFPSPLPYWNEYQWPVQAEATESRFAIAPDQVIDISRYMDAAGKLNWNAPPGKWVIMRSGMLPTGVSNDPASPEVTGPEVDKMSAAHVAAHFDSYLGEILRRIPAADRKSFKVAVADSYEKGGQNWTDGFLERFKARYGYDAMAYLPVMTGKVVGSQDQSDRFLWDVRRLVADNVSYEYVGGLREVAHKNGLSIWLENYGHWGFPGEFLQYGGQSDEIGGEFWNEGELGNIENRAASSAAHIYGKNKVSAESFTAGGQTYARYPALFKKRGDRFFAEGINNTLLHVYFHQPDDRIVPGINTGFGSEFNRHNTWFNDSDLFIQYLKRCNMMLQQGKYVADVAYFIGEDAPKMTGVRDPEIPSGYSYDYINAEVIESRVKVKDGKLVLPDGMTYSLLVLPKLETMRPKLLAKIKELVAQGAVVMGPKPKRSPSLQDFGVADQQVQGMADELWGQGKILSGLSIQEAMDKIKVLPDFKLEQSAPVAFIHRKLSDGDLYFLSNQSDQEISFNASFRVAGKQPELWDAVKGTTRALPEYQIAAGATTLPLSLPPSGSMFVVFRENAGNSKVISGSKNFAAAIDLKELSGPWQVTFDTLMRGPKAPVVFEKLVDWTQRPEESIKYYSGTAYYQKTFKGERKQKGQRILLDLGSLTAVAKVKLNGVELGGVWTAPYQVDVTDALRSGNNVLEIKVVNTWVNRLIGDTRLPLEQRKTSLSYNPYRSNSALHPAGLLGPVMLKAVAQ